MTLPSYLYEDKWGAIVDHADYIEICWYDATGHMTGDEFNAWLSEFAGHLSGALSAINPRDVARIDVLRDASQTAIYGLRGANGVVVITTKRPR